ncbi:hypothetical protein [Sphingomonas aracearum]|uniref:Lipoprotein n=1 Tax=Sphingomonas aracearum TaxID=2283317 RepID=A0A369VXV4_9SPHN|nr:hypothetical protein [Sphingomonas aracearum]RDE06669.1 hypothetical protein DVW87_02925 [Sphingomonas aracearum]
MNRLALLPLLALAGCNPSPQSTAPQPSPSPARVAPTPVAASSPAAPASAPLRKLSCAQEIGAAAAAERVKVCRNVSPATHPPCNAANSCALIEDEIARSCALFDGKGEAMPGCTPAPTSAAAAAAVVRRYYPALNARDFGTAWQSWGDDGPPGQPLELFEAGFSRTRSTQVTIGTLPPSEGAAGSIYQAVPVQVDATLTNGVRQHFTGTYTVRRVNNVDGATTDQLRWHIDGASLRPVAR